MKIFRGARIGRLNVKLQKIATRMWELDRLPKTVRLGTEWALLDIKRRRLERALAALRPEGWVSSRLDKETKS